MINDLIDDYLAGCASDCIQIHEKEFKELIASGASDSELIELSIDKLRDERDAIHGEVVELCRELQKSLKRIKPREWSKLTNILSDTDSQIQMFKNTINDLTNSINNLQRLNNKCRKQYD